MTFDVNLSSYRTDAMVAAFYDKLKPRAKIPVRLIGYSYTNPVQILGCINFDILKPNVSVTVSLHDYLDL
jgi:hypothetical protein